MEGRFTKYLKSAATLFVALSMSILFFFLILRIDGIKNFFNTIISILMPFIYGAVIAYILRPICNFFEKKLVEWFPKTTQKKWFAALINPICVTISILIGLVSLYMFFALVIPEIVKSITALINNFPNIVNTAKDWFEENLRNNSVLKNYANDIVIYTNNFVREKIQNDLLPNIQNIIGGVSSGVFSAISILFNVFMGTITAIYLLAGRKKLAAQSHLIYHSIVSNKHSDEILSEIKYADQAFSSFINGKLLASIIVGLICFVFTTVTDTPYGVLIAVLVGVTNMIPFFGPFIGDIPSLFLVVLINPMKALYLLIFLILLQQFEGNILTPKILGSSIGLSGLWILFSIVLFGGLFGFVGMVVGIPLFAVIYDIIKRIVHKRLAKKDKLDLLEQYKEEFHKENKNEQNKQNN